VGAPLRTLAPRTFARPRRPARLRHNHSLSAVRIRGEKIAHGVATNLRHPIGSRLKGTVLTVGETGDRRLGRAWVALTLSLAAHVADEALTGFLDVYNPIVRSVRDRFAWFPMPTFTFEVWIAGLCVAVAALFALSPLAFRRSALARIAAYPYAALMALNGVGHLVGSVYLHRWAPGTTTAPLLIATSVWLAVAAAQMVPESRHHRH
jgi:uncharacterized protein with HXXEE motif